MQRNTQITQITEPDFTVLNAYFNRENDALWGTLGVVFMLKLIPHVTLYFMASSVCVEKCYGRSGPKCDNQGPPDAFPAEPSNVAPGWGEQ